VQLWFHTFTGHPRRGYKYDTLKTSSRIPISFTRVLYADHSIGICQCILL
jgi:hypothetical protein